MNGGQREGSGLPLSGFALLIAIVGVIYWQHVPLESLRPEVPQAPLAQQVLGGEVVRARLWQDPFAAVVKYKETTGEQRLSPRDSKQETNQNPGLSTTQSPDSPPHSISALRSEIKKALVDSNTSVTILAVNVFGGPYSEEAELRLRWRYAVLSGLGASDYVAADSGHIGFIEPDIDSQRQAAKHRLRYPEFVPYEWLSPLPRATDAPRPLVLLLWINDDALGERPLESVLALMCELDPIEANCFEDSANIQLTHNRLHRQLLGPAGSGNLSAMLGELCAESKQGDAQQLNRLRSLGNGLEIFSSTATAEEQRLLNTYPACKETPSISALFHQKLAGQVRFLRTIATDYRVAQHLINELCQRRVVPGVGAEAPMAQSCAMNPEQRKRKFENTSHVVFVSEWDTVYGRALPQTIEELFLRQAESLQGPIPPGTDWAHRFSYLRGIDGQLPGTKRPAQPKSKNQSQTEETNELERAVGRGQFDYLRRLADSAKKLSWQLRNKGKGRVNAIGVLGSDYYDKQLVLQALRPRFGNAVFFTTDIDARLMHSADLPINRNLLVASSYGLALARDVQREIPPFRDGYQTSLFFATRLAVDSKTKQLTQKIIDTWIQPRVYEISREGAFDFGALPASPLVQPIPFKSGDVNQLYPSQPFYFGTEKERMHIGVILLIVLLLIFAFSTDVKSRLWQTLVWCRGNLGFAIIILAFIVWVGWNAFGQYQTIVTSQQGEPFSFTSGISAWPTTLIRMFAALLAVYYLIWMWWSLKSNAQEITAWIQVPEGEKNESQRSVFHGLLAPFVVVQKAFYALVRGPGRVWSSLKRLFNSWKETGEKKPKQLRKEGAQFGAALRRWWTELTIHHWRTETDTGNPVTINALWGEYQCRARFWKRILRSIIPFVIYFVLIIVFIRISEPPNIPVRGLGEGPQKWVFFVPFMASFLLLSFLTFFVVDASRLCTKFISLLASLKVQWAGPLLDTTKKDLGIEDSRYLVEWLDIQVIASRGNVVNKLIYYPFIVLLLLILARLSYFDSWNVPLGLGVSYLLIAGYALYSAIILQRATKRAKQTALDSLNDKLIRACSKSVQDKCAPEQVKGLIARITSLQHGAFVPISQQPIVRVMLLPLGGLGLALLDYLAWIQ